MRGDSVSQQAHGVLEASQIGKLLEAVRRKGYEIIGPTVRDGAIVYDRLESVKDLPAGWTDDQEPGRYQLKRRNDEALFGYAVGPQSWKRYLHPADVRLWSAERRDGTFRILNNEAKLERPCVFLGVRACELAAIAVQDRVLLEDKYSDPIYEQRRQGAFIIAVQCTQAAATCFCASMGTGPQVSAGFDLVLTELLGSKGHRFLVATGSDRGAEMMTELEAVPATEEDIQEAGARVEAAAHQQVRSIDTRRLFYCGEWIESHTLHVYMLHAPDFLGYQDVIALAGDHRAVVEKALRLKKIGNRIVQLLGGREIHPISAAVGGFYKTPTKQQLRDLVDDLEWALEASLGTVRWTAGLQFPNFEQDYEFVALRHAEEYPFNEGRLVSNRGLDIDPAEYEDHFVELQVRHSNALHSVVRGRGSYLVGPLARYNLNFDKLPEVARKAAVDVGLRPPVRNIFRSIVVRAVELVFACAEALRAIHEYEPPATPRVEAPNRRAVGQAITEAPRGILYHRYALDENGLIVTAKIVPPTSQNQKRIEDDLREYAAQLVAWPIEEATWKCEQAVRSYDPCISCATHFLKVVVEREGKEVRTEPC